MYIQRQMFSTTQTLVLYIWEPLSSMLVKLYNSLHSIDLLRPHILAIHTNRSQLFHIMPPNMDPVVDGCVAGGWIVAG